MSLRDSLTLGVDSLEQSAANLESLRESLDLDHDTRQLLDTVIQSLSKTAQQQTVMLSVLQNYFADRPAVHIVHNGRSLCPLSLVFGVPKDWPPGNTFVNVLYASTATCKSCRDLSNTLKLAKRFSLSG